MSFTEGQTIHGFIVERVEDLPEYDGTVHIMRHKLSGARLLYLQNDDIDKAFSIAFKTPPSDDTGVFHILEHSVLNGSRKFPVKEPFVNLLKNSMQTFLNALTFSDKTMYPVASTNERDLMNLADVYMDAVLHPAIYERPTTFQQEGWHVELAPRNDEDGQPPRVDGQAPHDSDAPSAADGQGQAHDAANLIYNGVVYNEMKGALAEPDSVLVNALCAALFPDTAYRFESGGDPARIPDLTYEQFLDTHARHYRLDNAYITLYGDLDAASFLEFLDEKYLTPDADLHRSAGAPNPLEAQRPLISYGNTVTMRTTTDQACMAIGYSAGPVSDYVRQECIDILLDAIAVNNEAPLKRALLDADLGNDAVVYLHDDVLQPFVTVTVKGLHEGAEQRLHSVIEEEVGRLASGGLDHALVEAAMAHAEFTLRERNFGLSDGVAVAVAAMGGWLYDDSLATAYLHYEETFCRMKTLLDEGYFEQLLREVFLEPEHAADARLIPVESVPACEADRRLADRAARLTPQERDDIAENTQRLRDAQNRPDTPEELATLPHLGIHDLGSAPHEERPTLQDTPWGPVLRHHVKTAGIVYARRYYDASNLASEDLPYLSLLCLTLGKLDTVRHTAGELSIIAQSKLGNLAVSTKTYESKDNAQDYWFRVVVDGSALAPNTDQLADIAGEVCLGTRFDDHERLRDILLQQKLSMEVAFSNNGHKNAAARAASKLSAASAVRQRMAGVEFYQFLSDLVEHFDERIDEVATRLERLCVTVFTQTPRLISFTGGDGDLDRYLRTGEETRARIVAKRPLAKPLAMPGLHVDLVDPAPEAFAVPTDVTYTAIALDHHALSDRFPHDGSWLIASRALAYDYLWNEVRVKGGAYGVSLVLPRTGLARFTSYRDPHLDETIERFAGAADWLEHFDVSPDEWEGYVVSTVAGMDAPLKPRALISRQDNQYIANIDPDLRIRTRNEVIATTPGDICALAPLVRAITDRGARVTFGSGDIISASSLDWRVTTLVK